MMRQAFSLLVLLVTLATAFAAPVQAQTAPPPTAPQTAPQTARGSFWLQIEAQPNLAGAEERASAWQGLFSDVAGFSTGSGWYVITLGPYSEQQAADRIAELRSENLIPRDSFVSDGATYGAMFWPAGATAPLPLAPDLQATDPLAPAADTTEALTSEAGQPAPDMLTDTLTEILPDETPEEARASESLLTQTEREDLQRALMWFGFYDAKLDGSFGRGTRASMAAWQGAGGFEPTGILTTAQRAALLTTYRAEEQGFGFQTVTESEAGIEATLPLALVAFDHYEPPFVHFTARDGSETRILLLSQPGDEAALAGLYDTLQTLQIMPATGPRSLQGDSFTLRGESAGLVTEAFATTSRGMVKGWLISWNPDTTPNMDRAVSTLRASFRPIGDRALDPGLVPLTPAVKSGLLAGLEIKKPRLSRSGFYVDATGSVLTTAEAVAQCGRITLDGRTEATVAATDAANGLALLKPASPLAPPAFAAFAPGTPNTEIAVAGYSYGDMLPAPVLTYGRFAAAEGLDGGTALNRLDLAAREGDTGGPVLTASGAVAGILVPQPDKTRALPKGTAFAAPPAVLAALLQSGGVTPAAAAEAAPLTPQDQIALGTAMTVLVSCWD